MPINPDRLPDGVVPKINARAKRLSLRADSRNGHIRLVIPPHCPDRKALAFTHQHQDWIEKTLQSMPRPERLINGAIIPLLGQDRQVIIQRHNKAQTHIEVTQAQIRVMTRRNDPSQNILRHLKTMAHGVIQPILHQKCETLTLPIPQLTLRDTKSRWGSCDARNGKIMLCWRLIFAPLPVIDYVVAHEAAHLRHMDHSPRFWALCQELCNGDMQKNRQWLADHGARLLRIGIRT